MRLVDYCKIKNIAVPKRFKLATARMDKTHDDFQIFPTPVIAFANYDTIFALAIAVKWGFWGIGIWWCHVKNIEVHEDIQ